jgi:hypothetical protein
MAPSTPRSLAVHETRRICAQGVESDAESVGDGREQEYELVRASESLQDRSRATIVGDVAEAAIGEHARDS